MFEYDNRDHPRARVSGRPVFLTQRTRLLFLSPITGRHSANRSINLGETFALALLASLLSFRTLVSPRNRWPRYESNSLRCNCNQSPEMRPSTQVHFLLFAFFSLVCLVKVQRYLVRGKKRIFYFIRKMTTILTIPLYITDYRFSSQHV